MAPKSKAESLATLVPSSPQNSPTLHFTEPLLEPVNPHQKDHAVKEGVMTQRPKSFQRLG